jgi:putative ABC transport system substrate-binding protein
VSPDPFLIRHRKLIIEVVARYRVPAIYPFRFFASDGELLSHGVDPVEEYRLAATYVDRILRGAGPADLAVRHPANYKLVMNLKAAKALGLTVPPIRLARADEVIE